MPIVTVHLVEGQHTRDQHARLLTELSARYAAVLDSPIERVRALITLHGPHEWAAAGVPATAGPAPAPYFTALVLEGRPLEQRHRLLTEFTDIIVDVLGVDRGVVRGRIIRVDPDDWGIGGVPASAARRAEIAARAAG
ncbi:tautomerase family protein [Pseudonocardia acidicola]|uniref:4-oxalocrotonate tautomerase n=1 Tax=Pseudonocardia acidicola TaxID=2724939 RepID=A0ABX1S603_9PSEU|nr:tautomerase family protein [Pseudonocardia acidicola]NMH95791.1 4-oxalocrotonate tautomerase [Pseudonocardia acidicola]